MKLYVKIFMILMAFVTVGLMSCSESSTDEIVEDQTELSEIQLKKGGKAGFGAPPPPPPPPPSGVPCADCDLLNDHLATMTLLCNTYPYPQRVPYCNAIPQAQSAVIACEAKVFTCPDGFDFDGSNCYSGIHHPVGYVGFIHNNLFYVEPNIDGVNANSDGCPPGFHLIDGQNCVRTGIWTDNAHPGFIYNRGFYALPTCE